VHMIINFLVWKNRYRSTKYSHITTLST